MYNLNCRHFYNKVLRKQWKSWLLLKYYSKIWKLNKKITGHFSVWRFMSKQWLERRNESGYILLSLFRDKLIWISIFAWVNSVVSRVLTGFWPTVAFWRIINKNSQMNEMSAKNFAWRKYLFFIILYIFNETYTVNTNNKINTNLYNFQS